MQRFRSPDGSVIAFSNGAMGAVYSACYHAAAERRLPETDEEAALLEWLWSYWTDNNGFAIAFDLDPVEEEIATPRRLAYLAELLRLLANDLAHGGEPDETIWQCEVGWEPERQAHWLERLDALAYQVEVARFKLVTAPRTEVG